MSAVAELIFTPEDVRRARAAAAAARARRTSSGVKIGSATALIAGSLPARTPEGTSGRRSPR
jgi:hypothetical protein